jgi:hypothetical protein
VRPESKRSTQCQSDRLEELYFFASEASPLSGNFSTLLAVIFFRRLYRPFSRALHVGSCAYSMWSVSKYSSSQIQAMS